MKILQLGKFYPISGGVEKVMYDLTKGLSARGVDCDMLCAAQVGRKGDNIPINNHGVVMTFRSWLKRAGTMIAPSMIWGLRRVANEYDIIHVHHPDPMASLALWLSGYRGRVILHWHSDILQLKHRMLAYLPLQNWLIRRAETIIGTTPVYLQNSPFLTDVQEKAVCVPIGIEPIDDVPEDKVIRLKQRYANKKIVFSLGRLVHYKGYDYLVRAAQYVDDDVVILIGGTGPLCNNLKARIQEMGLQDKVVLLGRIPDEDLAAYYNACDVYCMSSIEKTEAFGIVQIEAMSCGKPLIATNIPDSGVSWVNQENVSGQNVAPRDEHALADAINSILRDPVRYKALAAGSRQRFNTTFQLDMMVDQCLKIYNEEEL